MFIGHYGVSLAAKRFAPRVPLGALFVAAQLLDLLLVAFVLTGVEKVDIEPGLTKVSPLDLVAVAYSHSLTGAVLWSAVAALATGMLVRTWPNAKARVGTALVVALVVLSHFLLDLPMHAPDLPLGFGQDAMKVGLGLWNQPEITVAMELGLLVAGGALYLDATRPLPDGTTPTRIAAAVLVVLAVGSPFAPTPESATQFALTAGATLIILAVVAEWVDRKRVPAAPSF